MNTVKEPSLTQRADRRRVSVEDLLRMHDDADAVIEKVREQAFEPESEKILRAFSLREVTELLDIHHTQLYELLERYPYELPQGQKQGSKRLFSLQDIHKLQVYLHKSPRQRFDIREAVVITVANFKGGVAKTFTASTLAQYFALRGYRTLAIDLDPQGSLTTTFGRNPSRDVDDQETILPFFLGSKFLKNEEEGWTGTLRTAISPTYWHGLDLISANLQLYAGDFALGMRRKTEQGFQFHRPVVDAIDSIRADYDVIVIDTPPALSFSTGSAVFAADGLIIPAPAAMLDFESARAFLRMISEVLIAIRNHYGANKVFEFFRVLITKYEPGVEAQVRLASWQRAIFGDKCLPEAMLLLKLVQNIGPEFQTLYEHQPKAQRRDEGERRSARYRASRAVLKRAMESANKVNALLEADVIDVLEMRRAARDDAAREAAA